jgi:hypothetical protein
MQIVFQTRQKFFFRRAKPAPGRKALAAGQLKFIQIEAAVWHTAAFLAQNYGSHPAAERIHSFGNPG